MTTEIQSIERYRQAERALWEHYGAQPRERFLDLATPAVRVRVLEVGQGEPVLFVHGGPNAASTWAPIAAQLQGFHCILLDRPGCGLSDPIPYNGDLPSQMVGVIRSALDALGLERAFLVTSSFGGWCGLQFARAHPDRVRRLVEFGCPAFIPNMQKPMFMRLLILPGMGGLMTRMMREPNPDGGKSFFKQIGHEASVEAGRIPDVFWEWAAALYAYTDTFANDARLIKSAIPLWGEKAELTLTPDFLAHIPTPTAFYWGMDDTFGGPDQARAMVQAMPHAMLELVEQSGHLPWMDDPPRAAQFVRELLST